MEYKFKFYKVVACNDANGFVYKFACVVLSRQEFEKHFSENGWCHFIFHSFDLECVTTTGVLFLNDAPYINAPINKLLACCPEFVVYSSYSEAQVRELSRSGFPDQNPDVFLDDRDICVGGNLYEYLHPSASAVGTRGNEQGEDK